jgi:hypothetical protein
MPSQPHNHKLAIPKRPLTPKELDLICNHTIEGLKNNPIFDGLILMGSYIKQTQDSYSDIDFVIVVQDDALAEAVSIWKSFLSARLDVLTIDELTPLEWVSCLEVHAVGILKIDYDFIARSNLMDKVQTAFTTKTGLCHGKILYDKSGMLGKAYDSVNHTSGILKYPSYTMDQFIIITWSAIRMLLRGELFETHDILTTMRDPYISSLLLKLHDAPFENYRYFESKISSDWKQKIMETHCQIEAREMAISCIKIVGLFQDLWVKTGNTITDRQNLVIDAINNELEAYKENRLL